MAAANAAMTAQLRALSISWSTPGPPAGFRAISFLEAPNFFAHHAELDERDCCKALQLDDNDLALLQVDVQDLFKTTLADGETVAATLLRKTDMERKEGLEVIAEHIVRRWELALPPSVSVDGTSIPPETPRGQVTILLGKYLAYAMGKQRIVQDLEAVTPLPAASDKDIEADQDEMEGVELTSPVSPTFKSARIENPISLGSMTVIASRSQHWTGKEPPDLKSPNAFRVIAQLMVNRPFGKDHVDLRSEEVLNWLADKPILFKKHIDTLSVFSSSTSSWCQIPSESLTAIRSAIMVEHSFNAGEILLKIQRQSSDARMIQPHYLDAMTQTGEAIEEPFFLEPVKTSQEDAQALAHLNRDLWDRTLYFFKQPPQTVMVPVDLAVDGLVKAPKIYQALSVVHTQEQYGQITPVLYNSDHTGTGKTFQGLMLCWSNVVFVTMLEDIREFRETGRGHPHLPVNAPPGSVCPSIDQYPFRCACEPDSECRKWVPRYGLNCVVCSVVGVVPQWVREIDTFTTKDSRFKLLSITAHGNFQTGLTRILKPETGRARQRHQVLDPQIFKCADDGTFDHNKKLYTYVAVTTESSIENHVFGPLGCRVSKAARGKDRGVPSGLAADTEKPWTIISQFIIDEAHKRTNITGLHTKVLDRYKWSSKHTQPREYPTCFLMVTATPWKEPISLDGYWPYVVSQTRGLTVYHRKNQVEIPAATKKIQARLMKLDLKQVQRRIREASDRTAIAKASAEFRALWQVLAIERGQDTIIPEKPPHSKPLIPMPAQHYHVRSLKYDDKEVEKCNKTFVTQSGKASERLKRAGKHTTAVAIQRTFEKDIRMTQIICSLPSVTELIEKGAFSHWVFSRKTDRQEWYQKNEGSPPSHWQWCLSQERLVVEEFYAFNNSLLETVRAATERDPKVVETFQAITDVLASDKTIVDKAKKSYNSKGDMAFRTPEDEVDKILIICHEGFSAAVIAKHIDTKFPQLTGRVALMLSHITKKQPIIDGFQDEVDLSKNKLCYKEANRPRVLVSTYGHVATGYNFFRASHLIFFEPSGDPTQEVQGTGRIHRLGKRKESHVTRYRIKRLRFEAVIEDRAQRRRFLIDLARVAGVSIQDEQNLEIVDAGDRISDDEAEELTLRRKKREAVPEDTSDDD